MYSLPAKASCKPLAISPFPRLQVAEGWHGAKEGLVAALKIGSTLSGYEMDGYWFVMRRASRSDMNPMKSHFARELSKTMRLADHCYPDPSVDCGKLVLSFSRVKR